MNFVNFETPLCACNMQIMTLAILMLDQLFKVLLVYHCLPWAFSLIIYSLFFEQLSVHINRFKIFIKQYAFISGLHKGSFYMAPKSSFRNYIVSLSYRIFDLCFHSLSSYPGVGTEDDKEVGFSNHHH